jgi:hypothetical protein
LLGPTHWCENFHVDADTGQHMPIAEEVVCARCASRGAPELPLFHRGASVESSWLIRCEACGTWLYTTDSPATVLVAEEMAEALESIRRGIQASETHTQPMWDRLVEGMKEGIVHEQPPTKAWVVEVDYGGGWVQYLSPISDKARAKRRAKEMGSTTAVKRARVRRVT